MIIAKSIHAPAYIKSTEYKEISSEDLKGKKIFAFCGIGNPEAFLNTIKALGPELVGSKVYNDHHHYTDDCLADICRQATHLKADLILTTQKDWTKIISKCRFPNADFQTPIEKEKELKIENQKLKIDIPFAYLAIELKFIAGQEKLKRLIEKVLADKITGN